MNRLPHRIHFTWPLQQFHPEHSFETCGVCSSAICCETCVFAQKMDWDGRQRCRKAGDRRVINPESFCPSWKQ